MNENEFVSVKRINSLKNGIETKIGETYTDLTEGVQALMDGYGVDGSGTVDNIKQRIEGTLESYSSDTSGSFTANLFKTHPSIFNRNTFLKSVSLPNVTYLGDGMFQNCSALTNFEHSNAITYFGDSCFSYCSALKLEIRNTVPAVIGSNAFSNSGIQIFDSVITSWGSQCFLNSGLHTLIIRNTELLALSHIYVIQGTPIYLGTGYIYVPAALIEEYKIATNWVTVADQLRAIEDYPEITGGLQE